jgi:hypothetical protein
MVGKYAKFNSGEVLDITGSHQTAVMTAEET